MIPCKVRAMRSLRFTGWVFASSLPILMQSFSTLAGKQIARPAFWVFFLARVLHSVHYVAMQCEIELVDWARLWDFTYLTFPILSYLAKLW